MTPNEEIAKMLFRSTKIELRPIWRLLIDEASGKNDVYPTSHLFLNLAVLLVFSPLLILFKTTQKQKCKTCKREL